MMYPTDEDLESLPRIEMTNNVPWEPSRYDGDQHLMRIVNQSNTQICKFGVKIPLNHDQAVQFDEENGNTLWQDAEKKEIHQMFKCNGFDDRGHRDTAPALHLVYTCKHDGIRKARIVIGEDLTDPPVESIYSGVVSIDSTTSSMEYPSDLNPFDDKDFQLHKVKVNANTSRINLCESYVQHLCDKVDNQTVCTLINSE